MTSRGGTGSGRGGKGSAAGNSRGTGGRGGRGGRGGGSQNASWNTSSAHHGCCSSHAEVFGASTAPQGAWKKRTECFRCGGDHHSSMCTSDAVLQQVAYDVPPLPRHSVPYIDTHCHVDYMCEQARVATWGDFKKAHSLPETYGGCITTFCDSTAILSSFSQFEDLVASHKEVHHTFGLHPHNAKYWDERLESRIAERVTADSCVGWGEIGIDVTSEKKGGTDGDIQRSVFAQQLMLSQALCPQKTVVVHFRGDGRELIPMLGAVPPTTKLHIHSWGEPDPAVAMEILAAFPNLCFGFTGMICANPKMADVVKIVPLDRILLETDAPYMLPAPLRPPRGSRAMQPVNHPGNIPYIADEIAKVKGITIDEVLLAALENTHRMYGISPLILPKSATTETT